MNWFGTFNTKVTRNRSEPKMNEMNKSIVSLNQWLSLSIKFLMCKQYCFRLIEISVNFFFFFSGAAAVVHDSIKSILDEPPHNCFLGWNLIKTPKIGLSNFRFSANENVFYHLAVRSINFEIEWLIANLRSVIYGIVSEKFNFDDAPLIKPNLFYEPFQVDTSEWKAFVGPIVCWNG